MWTSFGQQSTVSVIQSKVTEFSGGAYSTRGRQSVDYIHVTPWSQKQLMLF
jgi:hypothetical protein